MNVFIHVYIENILISIMLHFEKMTTQDIFWANIRKYLTILKMLRTNGTLIPNIHLFTKKKKVLGNDFYC